MNTKLLSLTQFVVLASLGGLMVGCNSSSNEGDNNGGGPTVVSGTGPPSRGLTVVDFQDQANVSLTEMPGLPEGEQKLGGVAFQVGPKILQLGSKIYPQYPEQFSGIAIGRKFQALHALHGTQGGAYRRRNHPKHEEDGVKVGRYVLHYEDGSQASIPLVYGEDFRGWWDWDKMKPTKRATVAWTGTNPDASKYHLKTRVYQWSMPNPHPNKVVTSLDFISEMAKAAPFCLALTVGEAVESTSSSSPMTGAVPNPGTTPPIRQAQGTPNSPREKPSAEFEAARMRNEWLARIKELAKERSHAFDEPAQALMDALIKAALKASDARDNDAKRRLYEERNDFDANELQLPRSPEVRELALAYAEHRIIKENEFIEEWESLQKATPAKANESDRALLQKELDAAKEAVKLLTAERDRLAALPKPGTDTTAVKPKPPMPGTKPETTPPTETVQEQPKPKPKEFLGPAPADWAVKVDPPQEKVTFPEQLPYETVKDVQAKYSLYPLGRTPFLGVGKGSGVEIEALTVIDLRTGKAAGRISGFDVKGRQAQLTGPALSPNGAYLAIYNSLKESILVGSVRTNKAVAQLRCGNSRPAVLFPSNDRVLAVDIDVSKRAWVWELPSGKLLQSFTLPDEVDDRAGQMVCSPGGRYLACVGREGGKETTAYFYDLTTGKQVGSLKATGNNQQEPRFVGMAFSPDGTEFAALIFGVKTGAFMIGEAVTCWDIETGRMVYQRRLGTPMHPEPILHTANRAEPIQWFPDGQGWLLYQKHVVDRESALVTDRLDPKGEDTYALFGTKVLDDKRVLMSTSHYTFGVVEVKRKPQE